ncbi:TldD/PmbA family protein [Synechococcus sp. PCC 7336]|uniref:TldD/PmbA family protein n=1 Tax=Synechococcus sp. PCC 7336 TaxID=195250 RepID=UPI000346C459|nr:TldD/PmbA family protein [Synechococcus sp. PCC 7336]
MRSLTTYLDGLNRLDDRVNRHRDRVDFLLIRLESADSTDIAIKDDRLETLCETLVVGGHVRACHKGGWGFASFNDLDDLDRQIDTAISAARWVGDETSQLAPIPIHKTTLPLHLSGTDPRHVPLVRKKQLCDRYNRLLQQGGEAIASTGVRYSDSTQQVWIATSEGSRIEQTWTDLEMRFFATARQGDIVQTGRETTGSRQGFEDLEGLEPQVAGAADRAIAALTLPPVRGDTYTVVIDPILAGLFVHEAFGHLSEADAIYENPDLLEVMTLGRRFGPDNLQIWDGAAPSGHRGSYAYDDEGTPASATQLIREGCLVGRLHSRETAGVLAETPTGNSRCLDYHYAPIVRMTNTWIDRGQTPVAELWRGIDRGLYAANWVGGSTNGELFTFSAGEARMIRNGQLAEPVRDVTLSGNVFQTLADIEAIGDDFIWDESGGCGKGGQNGLPVGVGGPSLRIRNVAVGGTAH